MFSTPRIGDGDFDNGVPVDGTSTVVRQEPGVIYSYRVTATNAGGEFSERNALGGMGA